MTISKPVFLVLCAVSGFFAGGGFVYLWGVYG